MTFCELSGPPGLVEHLPRSSSLPGAPALRDIGVWQRTPCAELEALGKAGVPRWLGGRRQTSG